MNSLFSVNYVIQKSAASSQISKLDNWYATLHKYDANNGSGNGCSVVISSPVSPIPLETASVPS